MGVLGATFGLQGLQGGYGPSPTARAEIRPVYLRLYMEPGRDPFARLVPPESQTVPEVLHNRRITLTAIQRSDVRSGVLDPRLVATLADIGRGHSAVITALKSDHSTYTVDGTVSNHSAG